MKWNFFEFYVFYYVRSKLRLNKNYSLRFTLSIIAIFAHFFSTNVSCYDFWKFSIVIHVIKMRLQFYLFIIVISISRFESIKINLYFNNSNNKRLYSQLLYILTSNTIFNCTKFTLFISSFKFVSTFSIYKNAINVSF